MIGVLLAVPGLVQEPDLVVAGREHGLDVRRRCVDAVDLLAAAAADPVASIVVSSSLPRLTNDAVDRMSHAGRRVLGLAETAADADRLTGLGCTSVVLVGPSPAATLQQLAAAFANAGDPTAPSAGVWPTGYWDASMDEASTPVLLEQGRVVVVWGPAGAPGRTTVAMGVAEAIADTGHRTCLVDADTYAPSVALALGVVEDASGLIVACRHADNGSLTPTVVATLARRVRPGWHVLGGLPHPDRWTDLRAGALDRVWSACREAFDVTVVDVGFCLEEDASPGAWSRRRNAAALTALAAADHVVAVADSSAAGAVRLAVAWPDLAARGPGAGVTLVRNRARDAGRDWSAAVRSAGVAAPVRSVPADPRALASCWTRGRSLGEGAQRSRIRRALQELSTEVVGGWILVSR